MGKFVIKAGKTGVSFNLLATNGQVIGRSEVYKSDASCLGGIDSVRRCSVGGIQDLTVEGAEAVKHPKFVDAHQVFAELLIIQAVRHLPSAAFTCVEGIDRLFSH